MRRTADWLAVGVAAAAVLIGKERWEWLAGRWVAGGTARLRSPAYPWRGAGDPRPLGKDVRGVPVQVLGLDNPKLGPTP